MTFISFVHLGQLNCKVCKNLAMLSVQLETQIVLVHVIKIHKYSDKYMKSTMFIKYLSTCISAASQASLLTVQKVRKAEGFIGCLAGSQIMIMQLFLNEAQALDNP